MLSILRWIKKIRVVLEFDSNFKIMCIIVTYNETGGQEEGPKCKDVLKLLMSNARALETPKKKRRGQAGLYPSSMRNSKLY